MMAVMLSQDFPAVYFVQHSFLHRCVSCDALHTDCLFFFFPSSLSFFSL